LAAKRGTVTNVYCVVNCAESKTAHSIIPNESIRIDFPHPTNHYATEPHNAN